MREILSRLIPAIEADENVLLCRVVATKGSTPQKAGAAMLLLPDGGQMGTLGGGCVEGEVKRNAAALADRPGACELSSFVLNHDYAWADGLICGGKMNILAERPHGKESLEYFRNLSGLVASGTGFTEAIVASETSPLGRLGGRLIFAASGAVVSELGPIDRAAALRSLKPLADRPKPYEASGIAYLPEPPRIRLVIVGAGHVGQAVADLASRCDFDIWVIDDRAEYASRERFPHAQRRIIGPIGRVLPDLPLDSRTFALIVTRGHGHDQEALLHLAATSASYVGLIGSKRKIRMILDALTDEGAPKEVLSRVIAPVGLDIGSESVTEIAVSIVAELIAMRNRGREHAMSLRSSSAWAAV